MPELWSLSEAWESNKLDPGWQPRSIAEWQAILDTLGLTDAFWQIPTGDGHDGGDTSLPESPR